MTVRMSTYRFLGLILAQTEEEFIYFYSLGSGYGARKLGRGLWNAMYRYGQSEEAKEKHRVKVREYMRRKKQEQRIEKLEEENAVLKN